MSIPKEPRQLMINLMYLVLTAMLALNVSAQIINAFFALNNGITASKNISDISNTKIQSAIDVQVKAYSNPASEGYKATGMKASEIIKGFTAFIEGHNANLIKQAEGIDPHYSDGRPKKYKDKDITTRYFINEGNGAKIEAEINKVRQQLLALFTDAEDKAAIEGLMPLMVDKMIPDSKGKVPATWAEYKFKQMPVAAVMPLLTKMIADGKSSETAILNKMLEKLGITEAVKFDGFKVAIAPKQGYVIQGEKFEAEVYLAAFSKKPSSNVSISVNGGGIAMNEGVGQYSRTESQIGKQKVTASATVKNPLTGKSETVTGNFEYEVGRRSAACAADKMNVVYIGVDNPISVSVAGAPSNQVTVSGQGLSIRAGGTGYIATGSAPGEGSITVSAPGITQKFPFRVKRIPNPVPMLGNGPSAKGGLMGSGEFKAQLGIAAILENFDFEAKCQIQDYDCTWIRKNEDPVTSQNNGTRFEGKTATVVGQAKPGNSYLFENIKAKCPGDNVARNIGSLSFRIR
jgi:gliding motility-associated protein GldM